MTLKPSQRNRRALILLAAAVLLYLLMSQVVFSGYDQWRTGTQDAADRTERLRKYRQELFRRGNYEKLIADKHRQIDETRTHFFPVDAGGSAELQKLVEDSAKSAGIDLMQRTVADARKVDDTVSEIVMTLTFESMPDQLVGFLSQLRAAPKLVKIKSAQIDPSQPVYAAPKTGDVKKNLRVNMSLAGIALSAAQNKAK